MVLFKNVRALWHIFVNSLISPEYYKKLVFSKLILTIKYLAALALLYSVVVAGTLAYTVTPRIYRSLDKILTIDPNIIPDDIKFELRDGKWEFNKQEPFIIEWVRNTDETPQLPRNFIVIDKNGILTDLKTKDTYMLLNSHNLLVNLGKAEPAVYPLQNVPNVSLDKNKIIEMLSELRVSMRFVPLLLFFLGFSATLFDFAISRLIYFLMVAVLLQINLMITGSKLRYDQTLRIAIHSATLPILLEMVIGLSGTILPDWAGIWSPLMHMIIALTIIGRLKPVNTLNTQN